MRTIRAVGYGLVLLMGGASTASAQGAGGVNYIELFQQLDANSDLVIDRGEVPESGRAAFDRLVKIGDRNQDGKIDREEYRDMLLSVREAFGSLGRRFAEFDKDGDGKISKEEFVGPEPLFTRIDANGDGFISKDEAAKSQSGQGTVAGAGAGAGAGAAMIAQRLRAMDKDGDGKVSKGEFTGPPAIFDRLDTNRDGFITRDEGPGARPEPGKAKNAGRRPAPDKP